MSRYGDFYDEENEGVYEDKYMLEEELDGESEISLTELGVISVKMSTRK